jgi:hypothetical protein
MPTREKHCKQLSSFEDNVSFRKLLIQKKEPLQLMILHIPKGLLSYLGAG